MTWATRDVEAVDDSVVCRGCWLIVWNDRRTNSSLSALLTRSNGYSRVHSWHCTWFFDECKHLWSQRQFATLSDVTDKFVIGRYKLSSSLSRSLTHAVRRCGHRSVAWSMTLCCNQWDAASAPPCSSLISAKHKRHIHGWLSCPCPVITALNCNSWEAITDVEVWPLKVRLETNTETLDMLLNVLLRFMRFRKVNAKMKAMHFLALSVV